jgi:type II secretory pathway component GspD/PulD (secretin)
MLTKRKLLGGLVLILAFVTLCTPYSRAQQGKSGWDYLQNNQSPNELNQQMPGRIKEITKRIYKEGSLEDGVLSIKGTFDGFSPEKTVSLRLRNSDIKEVLRELAKEGSKNIIIDNSVSGSISADLQDVSLNQAMDLVLATGELEARIVDKNIFIASKTAMLRKGLNRRVVKSFKLNYAQALNVASVLESSIFNTGLEVTSSVQEKTAQATAMQATEVMPPLVEEPFVEEGPVGPARDLAPESSAAASGTVKTASVRQVRVVDHQIDSASGYNNAAKEAGQIKIQGTKASSSLHPVSNNNGGPIVVPDTRTNSLLIAGVEEDIYTAEQTIRYLDKPLKQVSIEVSLVEMSRTDSQTLGLSVTGGSSYLSGGFNNPTTSSGLFSTPLVVSPNGYVQAAPTIIHSATTNPANWAKTVGLATQAGASALQFSTIRNITTDIAVKINALVEKNKAKLIANPNVIALDGSESLIKLTQQVINRVTTTTSATGVISRNIELFDAGIVLNVKPQISNDGYITMRIRPSVTNPARREVVGDPNTSGFILDLVATREVIIENVRVRSGETIALAGLIRERENEVIRKTPVLGDLPLIGNLFKTTESSKEKTELIILLTPKIIEDIATTVNPINPASSLPID